MRRRRFSLSFVAALAVFFAMAAQAQAVAPTVTTGSASTDSPSSTFFTSTVDPHGCAVSIAYQYGTTTDFGQVVNSDQSAASGAQYNSAIAYDGLQAGNFYYWRVTATTTDCGGGATGETGTGATKCFVKKTTTNDDEDVACPDGTPGAETGAGTGGNTGGSTGGNTGGSTGGNTGGSTGGNTGGSTGGNTGGSTQDDSHAGNIRTPHVKGHRCYPTEKIGFVLEIITQGLKCRTPFTLLNTAHAHRAVGRHRRVKLGKFKCVAPWYEGSVAIYHCTHGKQGWYMSTFASGSWRAPNHVRPDW